MITKYIQDKAWKSLPEECRQAYREEYEHRVRWKTHESEWEMERLFGKHNLTSEPDKKTTKQELQERINELRKIINYYANNLHSWYVMLEANKQEIREIHYRRSIANDFYTENRAHMELNEAYKQYNNFKKRIREQEQKQREHKKQFKKLFQELSQYK